MVPSEPLVLVLGLAMLLVSIGCLLEHMAATMPLLLRAAWAVSGGLGFASGVGVGVGLGLGLGLGIRLTLILTLTLALSLTLTLTLTLSLALTLTLTLTLTPPRRVLGRSAHARSGRCSTPYP